jgi:uncharacterized membrane protein YedE/YeeE
MSSWWLVGLGGGLFGLGGGCLLVTQGRLGGISGLAGGLVHERGAERAWRALVLLGLLVGAAATSQVFPEAIAREGMPSLPRLVGAGLCVGIGARLANGCTSGHGICGVGRLSSRSCIAVIVFSLSGWLVQKVVSP